MTTAPPAGSTRFCTACGRALDASAAYCPNCGAAQSPGAAPAAFPPPPAYGRHSRVAAALFALLLGGLGVHKFYLGKILQGVLYLLFCWTFIPSVLGVIEGIVYLTTSDEAFAAKYP